VAIGHEVDISLAELAADQRASTPSNAAQLLVPDKTHQLNMLTSTRSNMSQVVEMLIKSRQQDLKAQKRFIEDRIENLFKKELDALQSQRRLINIFDPGAALKRGYSIVSKEGNLLKSIKQASIGDRLSIKLSDGTIDSTVNKIVEDA
jgi:exodeoxyribonuclease VII large subunit